MTSESTACETLQTSLPLQFEPIDRAYYSSNPAFTSGAVEPHPIKDASASILAQPEIAEVLEVVHISVNAELGTAPGLGPINTELALSGLHKIRKCVDVTLAPNLKREAILTKGSILRLEREQKLKVERAQMLAELSRQHKVELQKATSNKAIAQAAIAQFHERQNLYQTDLRARLADVQHSHPQIEVASFVSMGEEVLIVDESQRTTELKNGFQQKLIDRVTQYLRDPEVLLNDVELIGILNSNAQADEKEFAAMVVVNKIGNALGISISRSYFYAKDLTPELVSKWLKFEVGKLQIPGPTLLSRRESIDNSENSVSKTEVNRETVGAYREILFSRTLHNILQREPSKFIDATHLIGEVGFAADNATRASAHTAMHILTDCFYHEALAGHLLLLSTVSGNIKLQRKAIDIREALLLLSPLDKRQGLETSTLIETGKLLTDKEKRVIGKMFSKELEAASAPGVTDLTDPLNKMQQENISRFTQWAKDTPEGRSTTILSRILARINKYSL